MINLSSSDFKPLSYAELKEFSKMADNGQPILYDIEVMGRISKIQKKTKELKTKTKEYYSVTIRDHTNDYFIVHIQSDCDLKEDDLLYARGTLFKIPTSDGDNFVFLSASKIRTIAL